MSSGERGHEIGAADFFGNERFELEEKLGEGAYGVVYQAFDRVRETRVALKVMRRLGPDALFYFKKEFRALADLQHPNLVRYYELFEERGRWFLTMELVHGQSVVEYVRAGRSALSLDAPRFDEARLRDVLTQLASALCALHNAQKVHRDVKPSNVRVTPAGRVVLLDFGLVLDTDARESTRMPRVGTATFMAPEQIAGTNVGPEADYYAVGAVLYECLTGRHPFVGEAFDVLLEKQTRDPPRPSEVAPWVPLDLDELCMALLAREIPERRSGMEALRELAPQAGARSAPRLALSSSAKPPEFVGRARELHALLRLVSQLETEARVALVLGESGVGKSALIGELSRRLRLEVPDAVLLSGRCYERETVPFKAFDGVIDALARLLRKLSRDEVEALLPEHAELLAQVFPVLARVDALHERSTREALAIERADAPVARRRAFTALKTLLQRLAARASVVVIIDDVHWADADSIALLEDLLTPSDLPVLFVLVGRARVRKDDAVLTSFERLLQKTPHTLRLRLGPLAEADAEALAAALLAERSGPRELAHAIARDAGGQPLFIATLAHFVCTQAARAIPTLDEALRASVSALSDGAREVLATLAVAGAPLSRAVLARATGLDAEGLVRAVDEAIATRWVQTRAFEGTSALELVHERVREAVAGYLDPDEQKSRHLALAEALSRAGGDPEAAAEHWADAGAHEQVVTYARQAAVSALQSLAFGRAIRLAELALAHVPEEDPARSEIEELLAEALALAGRDEEAAARHSAVAARSQGTRALELRYRAATEWLSAGMVERGLADVEALLTELGVHIPAGRAALAWSLRSRRLLAWLRGHRWETRQVDELDARDILRVDALWTLTTSLSISDQLRGAELQSRHLEAALSLGEPYRLARAFAIEAWFVRGAWRGDDLLASDELRHAKELAQSARHPHAFALVELVHGVAFYLLGSYREAVRYAEAADRRLREECRAVSWERANAQLLLLACRFDVGDFPGVADRLRSLEAEGTPFDELRQLRLAYRFAYFERLLADEPDQARVVLETARDSFAHLATGVHAINLLGGHTEIDLYLGDPNAFARVDRAWQALVRGRVLDAVPLRVRGLFLRARAALGSAYLMPHQRARLLAVALGCAAELGRVKSESAHAWGALIESGAAELSGEREAALASFGEAVLACEACGMMHYASAARRRQGMLLGGDEGRAMIVRAERVLRELGAVDPGRISAVLLGY